MALPEHFERDTGCTEVEWLRWLPGACGQHRLSHPAPGQAHVEIAQGALWLNWQVLPERRIALARFPRLWVVYRFEGLSDAQRADFMRYFDLYMQRGGG